MYSRHLVVFATAVVAACMLLPVAAHADTTVDPVVAKAESLVQAGKDADALNLLNGYLAKHPNDARALADRGDAYQDMSEQDKAIADYTAALAVNPEYSYAVASRCDSRYRIDQNNGALTDCTRAIELSPHYAYPYRIRALTNLEMGDKEAALSDANQAVKIAADNAQGYAVRCKVLTSMRKFERAQLDCDTALKYDSANYLGRFFSGRLAIEGGRWSDAQKMFTSILDSDDTDSGSRYGRAIARDHLADYGGSLADIDAYVAKFPDDGDGFYQRALIEQHAGKIELAKTDATEALRHYRIDNDTDGAAKAQKLIDDLKTGH